MAKAKNFLKYPREYRSWLAMKQRCKDKPEYAGVTVDYRWRLSFDLFLLDMGPAPGMEYSIDRKDNSKGYYKDNCRWATAKEQANNRTNNVPYHVTLVNGYWQVRKYKDGVRTSLGTYKSRKLVTLLYGE